MLLIQIILNIIIDITTVQISLELNYLVNKDNHNTNNHRKNYKFLGIISSDSTHFHEQSNNVKLVNNVYQHSSV